MVAIPSIRLTTSEARRAMPKSIPIPDAVMNLGALTLLLQGLRTGNGDLITDGMHDRLHEPYRWGLIQGGRAVREAAMKAGAWGCVISGAGPSLLALAPESSGQAVGEAMGPGLGAGGGGQPQRRAQPPGGGQQLEAHGNGQAAAAGHP